MAPTDIRVIPLPNNKNTDGSWNTLVYSTFTCLMCC